MKWGRKWSHPGLIFSHNWGHIQPRQTNRFQEKADLIISILLLQCKYEYRTTSIANIPHSVWLFKVSSGLSSGPKNVTSACFLWVLKSRALSALSLSFSAVVSLWHDSISSAAATDSSRLSFPVVTGNPVCCFCVWLQTGTKDFLQLCAAHLV